MKAKKPISEIERLRRLVILFAALTLFLSSTGVGLVFLALSGVHARDFNQDQMIANLLNRPIRNGIDGLNGRDGESIAGRDGVNGKDGRDGRDSISTNNTTTVIKEVPVKGDTGAQGVKGDTGETGAPGKTVFTRTNIFGQGECRYAGDVEWQPESECE